MTREPSESRGRNREQPVGRFVRQQDRTLRIGRQHGGRTALDQDLDLLFGLAAGFALLLDPAEMPQARSRGSRTLINEQRPCRRKPRISETSRGKLRQGRPGERIEHFREPGAENRGAPVCQR